MNPRNPDWKRVVQGAFEAATFIQHLGIAPTRIDPGEVEASMAIRPEHAQQKGLIHAGVQTTLADHCAGAAAGTLMGVDEAVVSLEFKIHLLRPAMGERLYCLARILKPGRRFAVVESTVHTGDPERPTAHLLGTMAYVPA